MPDRYEWGAQEFSEVTASLRRPEVREIPVKPGLLLEDVQSGWVGVVVSLQTMGGMRVIGLEDSRGVVKAFPLGFGFLLEGEPVKVVPPAPRSAKPAKLVSRSGSLAVENSPARTARASRLWVEGIHDAELVEKIWGHDLRVEGIVVEPLHGVDDLSQTIKNFSPSPTRKLGILVDHLVAGSKESRIAAEAMKVPGASGNVKIVGHPYVDVWQAVKPTTLGITAWPTVPRDEEWKVGILRRFGWAHSSQEDIALGWKKLLGKVNSFSDLQPEILGPVESLIDFLTETSQS